MSQEIPDIFKLLSQRRKAEEEKKQQAVSSLSNLLAPKKTVRRVFFSFHYENDVWRVMNVRNSWLTKPDRKIAGYTDAAEFEKIQRQGEQAIKRWIDNQLKNTSVTVVLIGSETSSRPYVKYELQKSHERGNAIIGIYIHKLKDKDRKISQRGDTNFGLIFKDLLGQKRHFRELYKTYDWVEDDGYNNLGKWVDDAAKERGK